MTKNPTLLNYYFVGCGPKIQLTDKNDDTITSDTNKGLKRVHRSVGGIGKLQQIHSFWRDQFYICTIQYNAAIWKISKCTWSRYITFKS